MKTTYIKQLPEAMIERVYVEIQNENPRGCREEYEDAMDGRLCDLVNIDINLLLSEMEVFKSLNREVGHFEYGDFVWDVDGNSFMVTKNTIPPHKISLEDVKELYRSGYIRQICIDEEILSFTESKDYQINGGISNDI